MSKKILVIVFAVSLFVVTAVSETHAATKPINVTDQLGRTVSIKTPVERILCMQHHTLDIILELQAENKVIGVMKSWENLLGSYIADIFPKVKTLPTPGEMSEYNIEEVMALEPDVIFASNQLPAASLEQLEKLGIPVVVITLYVADREQASTMHPELVNPDEAYTEGLKQAIDLISTITGKAEKGKELWNYVITNRKIVSEHLAKVPEEKRIKVYMANENMNTYGTGKYVGVAMEKAGAKNVAETINGYRQVTIEQIVKWNPEVIFVQSRYASVLEDIKSDSRWNAIDAVKNGRLLIAPDYTKPWGNPAPESIALGELWLAKTLYPEAFSDIDLDAMVTYFYKNFYGVDFKDISKN
jgi:iron complex transport system substrate-binding protein